MAVIMMDANDTIDSGNLDMNCSGTAQRGFSLT
jgi:hypothetical protein